MGDKGKVKIFMRMGIPSYFRGILQKYPGCLMKTMPGRPAALCFDFNCLIYRCIRAPSMPVYRSEDHDAWEKDLLKEVERTIKEVWVTAGKPDRVLLAVDGVVPMAKIRQQRVRRFKSVWLRKIGTSAEESWDTNAITPGTEFMDSLGIVLHNLANKHAGWTVSGVEEMGEGEHKIMKWLRDGVAKGQDIVVYGLDADLILLSMLVGEEKGINLFLLREKQEFGRMSAPLEGQAQEYQFMNIREFQGRLGLSGYSDVLNYIGYMSLMGNDFLPHSLTHKLSDDGHEFVIGEIRTQKGALIEDGRVSLPVLKGVVERWGRGEETRILEMIRKKREQAVRGVGKGMGEEEGLALKWDAEAVLMNGTVLKEEWKDEYWRILSANYDVEHVCGEYMKGFQWIIDYYTGKPVNSSWMFPAWIPPLWSDLAVFLDVERKVEISAEEAVPRPQEQLAMVLPLESWGLIRDSGLRRLPSLMPQMWPRKFGFVSLGRKWLWECEAKIPVLMVERLRQA
jgi:5'-3' exonuclease